MDFETEKWGAAKRNEEIDEFRRRETRREVPMESVDELAAAGPDAGIGAVAFPGAPAGQVVELKEVLHSVRSAVAELPRWQLIAVRLKYFDGLTAGAIAAQTGRPLRTIERDLETGRRSVEESLVSGGIFHPQFGLAALAAAIPSGDLLSLSKEFAAKSALPAVSGKAASTAGRFWGGWAALFGALLKPAFAVLAAGLFGACLLLQSSGDEAMGSAEGIGAVASSAPEDEGLMLPSGLASVVNAGAPRKRAAQAPAEDFGPSLPLSGLSPADPTEPELAPVALRLVITDHGAPLGNLRFGINFDEGDGSRGQTSEGGPESPLHVVEEPAGHYTIHGDYVGKALAVFAMTPLTDEIVNNTGAMLAEGYFSIRIDRQIQEVAETVEVHLNTVERCFNVPLVEGPDYSIPGNITPSGSYKHVVNVGPAIWLIGNGRAEFLIEFPPNTTTPVWSRAYDGKLRFMATHGVGGDIRRVSDGGSIELWHHYDSTPADCDW